MKKSLLLLALAAWTTLAQAQKIAVADDTVDLGEVAFKHPATAQFTLKNTGHEATTIEEVRSSCGCTSVSYPRQPIAAGGEFTVSAVYDARQMGHFQKQVAIYADDAAEPVVLTLRGVVVARPTTEAADYIYQIGDLQVDADQLEFDDVNRGDHPVQRIHLHNNSTETVEPQLMHLPAYLQGDVRPQRIAPGHSGVATFRLDSRKLRGLGLTQTNVYLGMEPGDKVSADKAIGVSVILLPDFSNITEAERLNAPAMQLSKDTLTLNFGGSNGKKRDELTISNHGRSTLTIRALQMLTPGYEVSLSQQNIAAGDEARLRVTARAKDLRRVRRPRILIITNDPQRSKIIVPLVVNP